MTDELLIHLNNIIEEEFKLDYLIGILDDFELKYYYGEEAVEYLAGRRPKTTRH